MSPHFSKFLYLSNPVVVGQRKSPCQNVSVPPLMFFLVRIFYTTHAHTHTDKHTHTNKQRHTHKHTHTCSQTHKIHTQTIYTHTNTHTHTYTHTRIYTYTHTQACRQTHTFVRFFKLKTFIPIMFKILILPVEKVPSCERKNLLFFQLYY